MKRYEVTGFNCRLTAGRVDLTDEQHRRRAHCVEGSDNDLSYRIVKPIEFKRGEIFGHDGDLSRVPGVVCVDPEPAEDFGGAELVDLDTLSKAELIGLAGYEGRPNKITKAELIEMIDNIDGGTD